MSKQILLSIWTRTNLKTSLSCFSFQMTIESFNSDTSGIKQRLAIMLVDIM